MEGVDTVEAATPEGGKKKKPKLLLILAGGLILGGGGFAAYLFLAGGSAGAANAGEHGKADAGHGEAHGDAHGEGKGDGHGENGEKIVAAGSYSKGKTMVITREPTIVNLRDSKGTRYLKVRIGLEVSQQVVADEIRELDPQLSDFINEKLSACEIAQIDNTAGRNRLRRELLSGINEILRSGVVEKIYFTEFVIQ
jgi:flagellar protein FliL